MFLSKLIGPEIFAIISKRFDSASGFFVKHLEGEEYELLEG
jgi:hypothetical protein